MSSSCTLPDRSQPSLVDAIFVDVLTIPRKGAWRGAAGLKKLSTSKYIVEGLWGRRRGGRSHRRFGESAFEGLDARGGLLLVRL